ncbi:alpha/beta hydrolase [Aeromicrobium fastidiosum]|uniref:Alpha/beta hydrolase n=1 Tax=Aeromicrobium fastidiosum TaxID=52699 RepID=A0A641ANN1_9ACTN|nr:alpha/beta hydrolase [Aeromicrobium fastidiosum]KAA1378341.1 alpha/beta hydrolase [Aeromicrobium fastidiosum]MBP2392712.1 acetyl esterase [Aeromicrobium fastidiosum]
MTLHPQSRALLEAMGDDTAPMTPERVASIRSAAREAALAADRIGLDHVIDVDADGVPCRLYRPRAGAPVALYVHGGGWVLHDLETHDPFCRYLAHATGWALLAVDYRRAPEHPFPAPLDDVQTAASWLRQHDREHRVDASFLPAIGDSAGANLIAGLCVRDPRAVDFQALLYPPVDRRAALPRALSNAALGDAGMHWFWEAYAPGDLGDHPEVSPALATNLASHPAAYVVTNEHDVLRDQAEAYAAQLAEAGVDVLAHRALGMVHSFWRQPEGFDASRSTVTIVGALLDAHRSRRR